MNIIGPLRNEHQVIDSTLAVFAVEIEKIKKMQWIDPISIYISMDFIRTYTDLVHHGKEENILFRELNKKNISTEHAVFMKELMAEHQYSRTIVSRWMNATERYFSGEDTFSEILGCLQELIIFYPQHIRKENNHFFYPIQKYFTQEEQSKMIQEFEDFDDKILHWKYRKVESVLEERLENIQVRISSG